MGIGTGQFEVAQQVSNIEANRSVKDTLMVRLR